MTRLRRWIDYMHTRHLMVSLRMGLHNGLDPSYQIAEAIKLCEAADRDMMYWKINMSQR